MSFPIEKAQTIKLLILDIDGVLTSGIVYYGNENLTIKGFHLHDGLGIKLLHKAGIQVAVISAKAGEPMERRMTELNIPHIYLGHEDKLPIYLLLKDKLKLEDRQIAYMGDDLPDLPLMKRAGLAITVPNATEIILMHAHYITHKKAGKGAVREACENILKAQNQYESVLKIYLER